MSGRDSGILDIPPGIVKDNTKFALGKRWVDGNLVRWVDGILTPVGGWITYQNFGAMTQPIRTMFSWTDNSVQAWLAAASSDKCILVKAGASPTQQDITPSTLAWSPGYQVGYGGGPYGKKAYGKDSPTGGATPDPDALWSFDNFGQDLYAVHSQDGRLFSWSPSTPGTPLTQVSGAPTDNRLVAVTDERFIMTFGGLNHPRRVKWCSRENPNDWTAVETNSAGGFELDSAGTIIAVAKVTGGIVVLTDVDVHIIEYVGAPYWYSHRILTSDTGILSQYGFAVTPNGLIWIGPAGFWRYDGAVTPLPCTVQNEVFKNSYLQKKVSVFMGTNRHMQEVWCFYPDAQSTEATRYALFSYRSTPYWSRGVLSRSAMVAPVYQSRPYMAASNVVYEHERNWTADGAARSVYATTGLISYSDLDSNMKADRLFADALVGDTLTEWTYPTTFPFTITMELRQAPKAAGRTYGPVTFNTAKGYTTIRARAKLISLTVTETVQQSWGMGRIMLRTKPLGRR